MTQTPGSAPQTHGSQSHGSQTRTVPEGQLVLMRHGETEWSKAMRHTGLTDVPLTAAGEAAARRTAALLTGYRFGLVLVSPLQRARRTAELAGLTDTEVDANLVEWDYGGYEGVTTAQIRERVGYDWTVWEDGVVPGETPGESIEQVAARARAVIDRVMPVLERGEDVGLVAHGHTLRILTSVWLRTEPRFGAQIELDAGSVSVLGYERHFPSIVRWNVPAPAER